uniref:Uncharacterized protein n=1 Tax=Neolamprologus brichardi TaxID=32507 RepID=A0A3Q4GHM1_NEOBR
MIWLDSSSLCVLRNHQAQSPPLPPHGSLLTCGMKVHEAGRCRQDVKGFKQTIQLLKALTTFLQGGEHLRTFSWTKMVIVYS